MEAIIKKIGIWHSKFFSKLSEKAKNSKFWAILLTLAIFYELVEHVVYPILVPWLIYLNFWAD